MNNEKMPPLIGLIKGGNANRYAFYTECTERLYC